LQNSESVDERFNINLDGINYDAKFIFETVGYNLEPSEMGAAFGLVQLNKLNNNIEARESWFKQHLEYFEDYKDLFVLPKQLENSSTGWLAFPITIRDNAPFSRTDMQKFLENKNIQTRTIFTGNILRQPGFKNVKHISDKDGYNNADQVMRGGVLLACHHGLSQQQFDYIHQSVDEFIKSYQ